MKVHFLSWHHHFQLNAVICGNHKRECGGKTCAPGVWILSTEPQFVWPTTESPCMGAHSSNIANQGMVSDMQCKSCCQAQNLPSHTQGPASVWGTMIQQTPTPTHRDSDEFHAAELFAPLVASVNDILMTHGK